MTKLEEIKERVLERVKNKNFYSKGEKNYYIYGYLHALKDSFEINTADYIILTEELIEDD